MGDVAFAAGEIVDSPSMQDAHALDAKLVQEFLTRTPYGHASFLATYQSNGTRAADAIARAAQRRQINPIVLLAHAQMDQGLVGEPFYPQPPSRVEYAFGCGCAAPSSCDARYAGFDVQVDCLAAAIRTSLDAIAQNGATAGGWGPGTARTTTDGVKVTPADDSTAALYQYLPAVRKGRAGGNWLLWNIWQNYAGAIGYAPPPGQTGPASWIGEACAGDWQCNYDGTPGTCATQFPAGVCTLACKGSCPSSPTRALTFCADFGAQGGFCLAVCNINDQACREGYTCKDVKHYGGSDSQAVCTK